MTGRKDQLVEKLAQLAARLYGEGRPELDAYFSEHKFVRAGNSVKQRGNDFPVLEGLDLRNMVLTMYIMKHLRGNTILESSHKNDTFDLLSLARSLIKREVALTGVFLQVK
jgi:hypothetical protein